MLDHIGIGDGLLTQPDLDPHGEFTHQRSQLLQQVISKGTGVGHRDAIGTGQLDFGVGPDTGWHIAGALIGQAQLGVTEGLQLSRIGTTTIMQISRQRLSKG